MTARSLQWQQANLDVLAASMEVVRARLEGGDAGLAMAAEERARAALHGPSALDQIVAIFGLTPFERDLVVLLAAAEVLPAVWEACAVLQDDPAACYPTLGIALAYLQEASWHSLTPEGPLRRFRLIELSDGPSFTRCRVRLPERVLHFLHGVNYLEPSLAAVQPSSEASLVPSHDRAAERAASLLRDARGDLPNVALVGPEAVSVAASATRALNLTPFEMRSSELPDDLPDFVSTWNREALLMSAALIVEVDVPEKAALLARRARFPMFFACQDELRLPRTITIDLPKPTSEEMVGVWNVALGPSAATLNGRLEALARHFRLGPDGVRAVAARSTGAEQLWEEARKESRQALDGLAQRLDPVVDWNALVLPESYLTTLRQIVAHVRQRGKVYDDWGFGQAPNRGLGVSALFSGPSGTGKTLAAEVIAGSLRLDLYRIDLSQLVSKYIGETEKNLRRIFEAAEGSGAVLLFDEADALFGKRSEVRDSHDRYANIEVAYLLQRMEAYGGLVVLTTNLKNTLDPAFMRRIRFVLQFPFPEFEDRRRIWEVVFPTAMPREELDLDKLAGLSLAGGSIRNIALNAAFLAADEGRAVRMDHLLSAARSEFAKLERPMTELEMGGMA